MDRREYCAYLASKDWRMRRERLVEAHGGRCATCGIPRSLARSIDREDLHVDHLNYLRIGRETTSDTQLLCKPCHEAKSFREDRRKEHLAYCYGRLARTPEEWAVAAWLGLLEKMGGAQRRDRRIAEKEFARAAEELTPEEIDHCFAECLRQSLFGTVELPVFRRQAAELRFAKKHAPQFWRKGKR